MIKRYNIDIDGMHYNNHQVALGKNVTYFECDKGAINLTEIINKRLIQAKCELSKVMEESEFQCPETGKLIYYMSANMIFCNLENPLESLQLELNSLHPNSNIFELGQEIANMNPPLLNQKKIPMNKFVDAKNIKNSYAKVVINNFGELQILREGERLRYNPAPRKRSKI